MATRILPSNPQSKDEETLTLLEKMGEAGVTLPERVKANSQKEKTASIEKEAATQQEQAEYWRKYFEQAGLSREYGDWLDILFG